MLSRTWIATATYASISGKEDAQKHDCPVQSVLSSFGEHIGKQQPGECRISPQSVVNRMKAVSGGFVSHIIAQLSSNYFRRAPDLFGEECLISFAKGMETNRTRA